jgi:hypothetical protein
MSKHSFTALAAACLLLAAVLCSGAASAGQDLQAARHELRLRVETERRMRRDFETLLAGGRISAAEVADFEEYLVALASMVERQRQRVAKLEGADPHSLSPGAQPAPLSGDFDGGQTDAEKIALLDAELASSLSEFDEKLLREQRELAQKSRSSSSGTDPAEAAGGEGGSAGSGGAQGDQADGEAAGNAGGSAHAGSGESEQQSQGGEQAETGADQAKDQVAAAGGAAESGAQVGRTPPPPDIADGKDDDIVARQLREAAETEQDPELREKLWDEYRKYKNRTR